MNKAVEKFMMGVFFLLYMVLTSLILYRVREYFKRIQAGEWFLLIFPVIIAVASLILLGLVEWMGGEGRYIYLFPGKKKWYREEEQ